MGELLESAERVVVVVESKDKCGASLAFSYIYLYSRLPNGVVISSHCLLTTLTWMMTIMLAVGSGDNYPRCELINFVAGNSESEVRINWIWIRIVGPGREGNEEGGRGSTVQSSLLSLVSGSRVH